MASSMIHIAVANEVNKKINKDKIISIKDKQIIN